MVSAKLRKTFSQMTGHTCIEVTYIALSDLMVNIWSNPTVSETFDPLHATLFYLSEACGARGGESEPEQVIWGRIQTTVHQSNKN